MGWTVPLQQAAFRGVRFDVINVTDTFERALAEHAYPFVNGSDLEDMGLQPRRVQLQAVFFGKGYRTDLDKLVVALQKQGTDVLVHPIFGRMPNMICQSASLRHGDEFVNYVALDLGFVEVTEAKPIFVFEHSLWGEIDRLIGELEAFVDNVVALYGEFMKSVALAQNAKSRLLKVWSALAGVYESVTLLFGADSQKYRISAGVSFQGFENSTVKAIREIGDVIAQGLTAIAQPETVSAKTGVATTGAHRSPLFSDEHSASDEAFIALTVRSRFDEVLRQVAALKQLPNELATGKNDSVQRAARLKALIATFSAQDMQETACAISLISTAALTQIGVALIDENAETLLPADIEYIARHLRLHIAQSIDEVRQLQQQDVALQGNTAKQNTGVYTQSYQVIEGLRQQAHGIAQIALAAINRKPPLRVRQSPLNGTIQQVAHAFYSDYTRADELLRLNPQIRQPNFIQQGELINAYSK